MAGDIFRREITVNRFDSRCGVAKLYLFHCCLAIRFHKAYADRDVRIPTSVCIIFNNAWAETAAVAKYRCRVVTLPATDSMKADGK